MVDGCLAILGCSNRKRQFKGPREAIEVYDGHFYRVIRKARRLGYCPPDLDILIVSAKFGLIKETTLIEWYELPMSWNRAAVWRDKVSADLDQFLEGKDYRSILVAMGQLYRLAISNSTFLQNGIDEGLVVGTWERIVFHSVQMKSWLIEQHAVSTNGDRIATDTDRGRLVTLHSARPLRTIVQMAAARQARGSNYDKQALR